MQWFIFIVMTILFIVTPYQKGLYFMDGFYSIALIILALFLLLFLRLILFKEVNLIKKGYIVVLLPLSYLLSIPFAESPAGAWDSLIRWTTYAAFFLLLYWSSLQTNIKKWLPVIFQVTGGMIALHMIFIKMGWFTFHNGVIAGRFAGVFQYPNTFGMVMALFFLYALTMATKEKISYRITVFYAFLLPLYFICFLLSYSRGMLLILPIVWLIGFFLLPIKEQVEYMVFTLISTLLAFLLFGLMTASDSIQIFYLLGTVILSTALIVSSKYVLNEKVFNLPKLQTLFTKKAIRFVLPMLLILVGVAGFLDLKNEGLIYQALPEQLQERVNSISVSTATAKERGLFVEDAFGMSKESPLIGLGGEAWASVYKSYQQTPYISNKIHNGYLEWLVDTGWIGLGLFIIVFSYFFYHIISAVFRNEDTSHYVAIILSLLIVFIHSLIDFNFSYGTVWLLVFWLLVMGISSNLKKPATNRKVLQQLPMISLVLLTGIVSVSLFYSFTFMQATQDFNKAKHTNSLSKSKEFVESAVRKNPYQLTYRYELSDIYLHLIKNYEDAEIKKELHSLIDKTISLEPQNSSVWLKAAALSSQLSDEEKAIHYGDEALKYDYFNAKLYEMSITNKVNHALEGGDNHLTYVQSAIDDYEKMLHLDKKYKQKSLSDVYNSRNFHITNEIYYQASLAYVMDERYDSVINTYKEKEELKTELKMRAITIFSYKKLGEEDKAKELYSEDESEELLVQLEELERMLSN